MPAERLSLSRYRFSGPLGPKKEPAQTPSVAEPEHTHITPDIESTALCSETTKPDEDASRSQALHAPYPTDGTTREKYRNPSGKRLTAYQWKVYDYLMTIPQGKITTYKGLASAVGGSPRSAGTALRNNPFSPYVPCHRVIASDLYIGGFCGEWAKKNESLPRVDQKRALLAAEGVLFDQKGYLRNRETLL
ncbi:DNA binding methylated-DNA--cysteine S-methyltransferase [Coprinellus micaceus]|uniref:Methylated-DNA--protein-cysteine methyltransferase n=1 Tax=Coprinellus micaceus TaxID=71717 RepID=A0A4Y7T4C0_COPMI|nr:DNA binding methylated-DNA--cysteine S-methyltransferase [Coprinellus micaceus]